MEFAEYFWHFLLFDHNRVNNVKDSVQYLTWLNISLIERNESKVMVFLAVLQNTCQTNIVPAQKWEMKKKTWCATSREYIVLLLFSQQTLPKFIFCNFTKLQFY